MKLPVGNFPPPPIPGPPIPGPPVSPTAVGPPVAATAVPPTSFPPKLQASAPLPAAPLRHASFVEDTRREARAAEPQGLQFSRPREHRRHFQEKRAAAAKDGGSDDDARNDADKDAAPVVASASAPAARTYHSSGSSAATAAAGPSVESRTPAIVPEEYPPAFLWCVRAVQSPQQPYDTLGSRALAKAAGIFGGSSREAHPRPYVLERALRDFAAKWHGKHGVDAPPHNVALAHPQRRARDTEQPQPQAAAAEVTVVQAQPAQPRPESAPAAKPVIVKIVPVAKPPPT